MALRYEGSNKQPRQVSKTAAKSSKGKKKKAYQHKDCVDTVKTWVEDCKGHTETWESNQVKWHKLRMRIKKKKTFPFIGCSNIRMPTLDTKVKKSKAALSNVIFGIRPIVQAIPSSREHFQHAQKVEKFLDHLLMDVMKIYPKSVISIDQMLEKGFYLMKPYWRTEIVERIEEISLDDLSLQEVQWIFAAQRQPQEIIQALVEKLQVDTQSKVAKENMTELERVVGLILEGRAEITVNLKDIQYDFPDIDTVEPERCYVPTTSGYDPQSCQYIIHEFYLPLDTLKQNAEHKGWDMDAVDKIGSSKDLDIEEIDTTKDEREGIERLQEPSQLVRIWECYCWYDINGDGRAEKAVITMSPDFSLLLRKISLPFYSGKFPFVKLFYELIDDRWFSHRGMPEMIEDIVKEIDVQHMQKIDSQTIRNAPMYVYRSGMVNLKTVQFVFGQGIPVQGMQPLSDAIQPLNNNNTNVEYSYEREQMLLETKVEELVGQVDFSLQSMINKRQPRTLGEVQLQQQTANNVFLLDSTMIQHQFEELFNWVWDLWCQYGPDEYEFAYFGKEGWEKIKIGREDVQGKLQIKVRGNDQNTNPSTRVQKAQMILMSVQNPAAMQTGVVTPLNIYNAYKNLYQELDITNWQELVTPPQPPPPQPPPPPPIKTNFDELTDAEQAQVLARMGIKPDAQGRALERQQEVQAAQIDQANTVAKTANELAKAGETRSE